MCRVSPCNSTYLHFFTEKPKIFHFYTDKNLKKHLKKCSYRKYRAAQVKTNLSECVLCIIWFDACSKTKTENFWNARGTRDMWYCIILCLMFLMFIQYTNKWHVLHTKCVFCIGTLSAVTVYCIVWTVLQKRTQNTCECYTCFTY